MSKKELFKGIKEDEILATLTENLMDAKEKAASLREKAERREYQLRSKYDNYDTDSEPINTYNIDDIEKAVEHSESKEELVRKILAMQKVKNKPWSLEKNYREAMAQYYTYIAPILTDLEAAKQESRMKVAEIKARYNKELAEATQEFNTYEDEVEKLFMPTGEVGLYMYNVSYLNGFGRTARSDNFAAIKAEEYSKTFEVQTERVPKITKHQSIDGVQHIFSGKQR